MADVLMYDATYGSGEILMSILWQVTAQEKLSIFDK